MKLIYVGNCGAGWFPPLPEARIDTNGWGTRKIEAIRQRRADQHAAGLDDSFQPALAWVEQNLPEFSPRNKP